MTTQKVLRVTKGTRRKWTPEEIRIVIQLYPNTLTEKIATILGRSVRTVYQCASKYGLRKSAEFMSDPQSGRLLKGIRRSPGSEFRKGQPSWNKGMKGLKFPGSEKTWFRKGHLPKNTMFDGAIKIRHNHKDRGDRPYRWIRISKAHWKQLHVHVWECAHGPVPAGHIVVFADGDTMNCDISNLRMISRKQHAIETREKDGFIAKTLCHLPGKKGRHDKQLQKELMKRPDILDAKRKQLELNRIINEQSSRRTTT